MLIGKPYEHGHAPAGDAHNLGTAQAAPAAEIIG
jgi:hypothetical protein